MLDSFSSVLCMYCTVYSGVPGVDGEKVSGWTVFLTVYCVSTVQCSPRGRWREGIRLDSVFTVYYVCTVHCTVQSQGGIRRRYQVGHFLQCIMHVLYSVQCSPRGRWGEGIRLDSVFTVYYVSTVHCKVQTQGESGRRYQVGQCFYSVLCMYCTVYTVVPRGGGEGIRLDSVFTVYYVSTVQCSPRGRWGEGIRLDSVFNSVLSFLNSRK